MRILIIENSVRIIQRLEEILSELSVIASISSTSHRDALGLIHEFRPDLVLLGFALPETKSIKLLSAIQADPYKKEVIILYLSLNSYIHTRCSSLGVRYFVDIHHEFDKIPGIINRLGDKSTDPAAC